MHAIPGSPFAGETSKLPANVKEKLVEQYGLDKPVTEQYVRYLQNAVKGDFGTSLNRKGKAVSDIIMAGIPYTASLGLAAFLHCTRYWNFTRNNFRIFQSISG